MNHNSLKNITLRKKVELTVVILTYNEEANIKRTLNALSGMKKVLVVDSFSNDETVNITRTFPNTTVIQRAFDNHTNQWNYGLDHTTTNWVLSLDADYIVSDELCNEIEAIDFEGIPPEDIFSVPFKYCIFGLPLKGTVLPPRPVIFNKKKSRYYQDGHTQQLQHHGKSFMLKNHILHDDRKKLSRWLIAQDKYANLELDKYATQQHQSLSLVDKIRTQTSLAPFLMFFYCYLYKGTILNGRKGLYYSLQRAYAELLLLLKLLDSREREKEKESTYFFKEKNIPQTNEKCR